jgi:hypothetical protein
MTPFDRLIAIGFPPARAQHLACAGYDVVDVWPLGDLSFFEAAPCDRELTAP